MFSPVLRCHALHGGAIVGSISSQRCLTGILLSSTAARNSLICSEMDLQTTPPGCVPVPITRDKPCYFIEEAGPLTWEHVGIDICDTNIFSGFVCCYHVTVYFSALQVDLEVRLNTNGAGLCAYHATRLHVATHYNLLDSLLGRTTPEFA